MREIVWLSDNFPHSRCMACCSVPNSRPPATKALHTTWGNNTSIVSSSWWWAFKCPKHVEQIISAIKHSVASSWLSYLRLYYDARTNIHQIYIKNIHCTLLMKWMKKDGKCMCIQHNAHEQWIRKKLMYIVSWKSYIFECAVILYETAFK